MNKTSLLCLTAGVLASVPALAFAQDSDNDGVPNAADTFPCDAAVSGVSYAPAENSHGTMVFEDMWPAAGDLDFNDVVLRYNYAFQRDASGGVRRIRAVFNVSALGGGHDNGLGLHLPVAGSAVTSITRTIGSGMPQPLARAGADSELTVVLSSNLRELFGFQGDQINSLPTAPRQAGDRMVVDITFASPVTLATGGAPFDLYVFRTAQPSLEIHRPEFPGTAAMNPFLFGTVDDHSTSTRHFVDYSGLPFALVFPTAVAFPVEAEEISSLYPNILGFAASGGTTNTNFYTTGVDTAYAYADSAGQAAPSPTMPTASAIDISCVPVGPIVTNLITGAPWTVPAGVTSVRIEAAGAQGGRGAGGSVGGRGAQVAGTFAVTPGQVLTVVVGGVGGNATYTLAGGGGGGGSFVSRNGTLLLAAAGGGGGGYYSAGNPGGPGLTTALGSAGSYTWRTSVVGQGGYSDDGAGGGAGAGGGGWLTAGTSNYFCRGGAVAGGIGGTPYSGYGGFGGVGGGGGSMHGGGGGGGYSGGGGGHPGVGGGGGGSYNIGTNPVAVAGAQAGAGAVSISY